MWSNFRRLHAVLAISCLHIVSWFSSTPLNNDTLFANAEWGFVLCWGCSNELNEPLCVCLCVFMCCYKHWGCNGKSEQLSFRVSTGSPLLTCSLYWITPTLIVSPNVSLGILIALQQHRISSLHLIYVDTECKTHVPLPYQPVSSTVTHCWTSWVPQWKTLIIMGSFWGWMCLTGLIGNFPDNLKLYRSLIRSPNKSTLAPF